MSTWNCRLARLLVVVCLTVGVQERIGFVLATKDSDALKEKELYENCGNGKKVCYGDTDSCVSVKSCGHMVTITDLSQSYNISFLDKCHHGLNEPIFSAAAAATFNHKGELDCSKELTLRDFKMFIFWKGGKCNKTVTSVDKYDKYYGLKKDDYKFLCMKKVKENSGKILKNTLNSKSEPDLNEFLNHFVLFSTLKGEWSEASRPFNFSKTMNYSVSKDKVFYSSSINRGASTDKNSSAGRSTWISALPLFVVFLSKSFFYLCHCHFSL